MKKYLIVYYSRTGTSKKAAEKLHEILDGESDIEEIVDIKKRSGLFGYISSIKDALANNIAQIDAVKTIPNNYENVVVVTPIWAGKIADAIRTYLSMYKTDIKSLILITCSKGSKGDSVKKDIYLRFALKAKILISLKERDVLGDKIDEYLNSVKGD